MFAANITSGTFGPQVLGEVALNSGTAVLLSEFSYKSGTEIYGKNEPADYVYQVKEGAVRSYKLLSDGRRQIGAFPWLATFLVSRVVRTIVSPPKLSKTQRFV